MSHESPIKASHRQGNDLILDVVGDIGLNRSQAFQDALSLAMESRPGRLVLNLSAVVYMDSAGVASLIKLLSCCRRQNVPLVLVGLNPQVRSVFEITRLIKVFNIVNTEQEALAG